MVTSEFVRPMCSSFGNLTANSEFLMLLSAFGIIDLIKLSNRSREILGIALLKAQLQLIQ